MVLRGHTNAIYAVGAVLLVALHGIGGPWYQGVEDALARALRPLGGLVVTPVAEPRVLFLTFPAGEPPDRPALGRLLARAGGAGALALEVPLEGSGDEALAAAVAAHGRVVLLAGVRPDGSGARLVLPPDDLAEAAAAVAYAEAVPAGAVAPERIRLAGLTRDASRRGMVVEAFRVMEQVPAFGVVLRDRELAFKGKAGETRIRLDGDGALPLPLRPVGDPEETALAGLLASAAPGPIGLDGRAVWVGPDRPATRAQVRLLAALLAGKGPVLVPDPVALAMVAVLGILVGLLGGFLSPLPLAAASAALALLVLGMGSTWGLALGLALPLGRLLGLVATVGALGWLRHAFRPVIGVRVEGEASPGEREAQGALQLGIRLLQEGKVDESVKYFQKLAKAEGALKSKSQCFLALVLLRRGEGEAAKTLVSGIDFRALDGADAYTLAEELERRGHLDTAHTLFEQLARSDLPFRDVEARLEQLKGRLARFGHDEVGEILAQRILDRRYQGVTLVGSGGMGFVFKADDAKAGGRKVAIKILSPFFANIAEVRVRFLREARGIADMDHPNIVKVFDVFEANIPYYSMEYLTSLSLKDVLAGAGRFPPGTARTVAMACCEGLGYAHGQGIVHRDIKPDNIMVDGANAPKIIDFGIALFAAETQLTQAGHRMGTPRYMSPEQVKGEAIDHRTDIYSLGIVLHELLAGTPPYETLGDRLRSPPPAFPPQLGVGPALDAAVKKAMALAPEERFPSMAAFKEALAAAGGGP